MTLQYIYGWQTCAEQKDKVIEQQAAEIAALRGFAHPDITSFIFDQIKHGDDEHQKWLETNLKEIIKLRFMAHGLVDENGNQTPLLTGEASE